jgi:1,3-beta-glucanosyltransferase GAS1
MEKALTCIPSNRVTDDSIGTFFGILCGLPGNPCAGIAANATSGVYGAYGMCDSRQQLGWALNTYYQQQQAAGNGASACAFSGSATTQAVVSPTGACATLISQAGAAGTGTVTSAPSGTGSSGSGGSSSKGAAAPGQATLASLNFGTLHMGLYVVSAVVAGAGMILL